ncbi:MAG: transposase [Lachnospiraceae bacterium]|nr:transposase [Lachnospiraceae bacterium]
MNKSLSNEALQYIIERIMVNAKEARDEAKEKKNDLFLDGRNVAYYEVLDILKTELDVRDIDIKEMGLDVDLEKNFL